MVDQYNKVVADHGIPPEEMRAICVTPHEGKLQGLEGVTFDVIVVSGSLARTIRHPTLVSHSVQLRITISLPSTR